jgi:uncharacterized protein YdeI (YjbR/CyaY-like superfamily)
MKGAKSAGDFINNYPEWHDELTLLREIFLSGGIEETIKWGIPVYVCNGKNVSGMAAFKSYVGIWFYQGALLQDHAGKLLNAQEGITKALRQWRFSNIAEIQKDREMIHEYFLEAIQNAISGKEIKAEKKKELVLPDELNILLESDPGMKLSFEALSLSKRREFAEHVGSAKRAETRAARLQKIIPMILRGEGLNDKYLK